MTGPVLDLETLVTATEVAAHHPDALRTTERLAVVTFAERPVSLAEISAALEVPIGEARRLVGDLADAGYLSVAEPCGRDAAGRPRADVLEKLLHGLRAG